MVVCVYGCVSTVHPPPYFISASEAEERSDRRLFAVYRIGILWVFVLRERQEKAQWSTEENHFNQRPQVSEYSQVWFADILEQLLLFYRHKQNKSDDRDAPAANYAFIFCVISDTPDECFMCLCRHLDSTK